MKQLLSRALLVASALFLTWLNASAPAAPIVVSTSATYVSGSTAALNALVSANGAQTTVTFQYGLTTSYGSSTVVTTASDNAESYATWAYGSNGGSGFGPATYLSGAGGGIYLESGSARIDGSNSFGLFSSTGGQGMVRPILNPQASGTLSLSLRFNVTNTVAFSGFNLKSALGTTFGSDAFEMISVGIHPTGANPNNTIVVNGGAQANDQINLGSSVINQIVDFSLTYNGIAGTYTLGAKFRANSNYTITSGTLKNAGVTPAYLGFGNFNTGSLQNLISDDLALTMPPPIAGGTTATVSAVATGLTPNSLYHYRAVAVSTSGTTFGPDQTFGYALVPPNGAAYHSYDSGNLEARIYDDTGHIAIAGPDLAGNPLANVITFAPPTAIIGGASYVFGPPTSITTGSNGLQFTQSVDGQNITAQLTFPYYGVMRYAVTDWGALTGSLAPSETDVIAASGTTEHFFGFGEKFDDFDQAGNLVHTMTLDTAGTKIDSSYKPVPWFISNLGYGFHLDSTAESYFDMRNSQADRYIVRNLYPALQFNVVYGPQLTSVLSNYTAYTGRPYLPPPWVFGTWISSDIWRTGGEVKYAVLKYLASGIPASVFVFDSPWETAYNDFNWNLNGTNSQLGASGTYSSVTYNGTTYGPVYSGFTSVNDMMTFFQTHGIKVVCWFTPFTNTSSFADNADNPNNSGQTIPGQNVGQASNYAAGAAGNYFVLSSSGGSPLTVPWWKGTGSPIDFTNPAAVTWFTGQLQNLVAQSNVTRADTTAEPAIGGFKTDDGESGNGSNTYIPTTAVYSDGRTGILMRNGYAVTYHKAVSGVLGTNGILFARSGFTGTQQYPGCWAGDNSPDYTQTAGLQSVMTAGVSAAMSGFSIWSHDIGGYLNPTNSNADVAADLFMRWAQFGAFTPIMAMHRSVNSANERQYPWGYPSSSGTNTALTNYVAYASLHSQLFPYIYTYAQQSSITGLPIIRPLVLTNQTDATTYGLEHTYNFGNEFLVAPVNAQQVTTRGVYLPAGTWYDYWTNAVYTGGQTITWTNTNVLTMPLYVRQGSIIPMLISVPQTLCTANYVNNPSITTQASGLQFLVYPGPSTASFNVYDGTTLQCTVNGTVTTLPLYSAARPVVMKVLASSPAGVERNGTRLPQLGSQTAFNTAALGWYYDASGGFLYVKFTHPGGSATITFGPDSVGDGITDSWRQYYNVTNDAALAADGDGYTNAQDYHSGTNPNDPSTRFCVQNVTSQTVSGQNTVSFTWQSQQAISYQIQWKNELTDATWQIVSPNQTGTGATMTWTDDGSQTGSSPGSAPNGRRFYRLVVP